MPEGHPHQLRDTFACDLLTKGVPLEELVCGTHDLSGARGTPPKQVREISTADFEVVVSDRDVEGGYEVSAFGQRLVRPFLQADLIILLSQYN